MKEFRVEGSKEVLVDQKGWVLGSFLQVEGLPVRKAE